VLDIFEGELYQVAHDSLTIKFMHANLPKRWKEYKYLIDTFFLLLIKGSNAIYQVILYHWSAPATSDSQNIPVYQH